MSVILPLSISPNQPKPMAAMSRSMSITGTAKKMQPRRLVRCVGGSAIGKLTIGRRKSAAALPSRDPLRRLHKCFSGPKCQCERGHGDALRGAHGSGIRRGCRCLRETAPGAELLSGPV